MKKYKSENFEFEGIVTKNCPFDSIIDNAYLLLTETKITYKQIASDTGLNYGWLYQFIKRYKKGQDFHARKLETLIKYLSQSTAE